MPANKFNGILARQSAVWRGTSTIAVPQTSEMLAAFRGGVNRAVYNVAISGGISGNFSVMVNGLIGGQTCFLAGRTNTGAVATRFLYPVGYSSNGTVLTVPLGPSLGAVHRYDTTVAPSHVQFIATTDVAGVSATVEVYAVILGGPIPVRRGV